MLAVTYLFPILILVTLVPLIRIISRKLRILARQRYLDKRENNNTRNFEALRTLASHNNETAAKLCRLIDEDGAGEWPPRADHDGWPSSCLPYKTIYIDLSPLLPSANPSLDDDFNTEKQKRYRSLMRKMLSESIDIRRVEELLAQVEAGHHHVFPCDQYNGFYCCIAVLRHAYRWATIPVVRAAQLETIVDFPRELDVPWLYLQRRYGVDSDSGNVTSNFLYNIDTSNQIVYKINPGMSDTVTRAEEVFCRTFLDTELLAFPIYCDMVQSLASFKKNDEAACIRHLKNINVQLQHALRVYYRNLTESRISRTVWLSYIQGFQAWGVGRVVNGQYVKFDGLSGSHVLLFQALDAFLGMDRYMSDTDMQRYIPVNQRELCLAFKRHSFRTADMQDIKDTGIEAELAKIAGQLRIFRHTHRARAAPYLRYSAPERLAMTAGKSVIEGPTDDDTEKAFKRLDALLAVRLDETR